MLTTPKHYDTIKTVKEDATHTEREVNVMRVVKIEKDRNFTRYFVITSEDSLKIYEVCDHATRGRFLVSVDNTSRLY